MIRYASVCSGIEGATLAWHHLGWVPAFFSEIEPFPSAVLAERTMLHALRGGCLAPVAALGEADAAVLKLAAVVLSGDGQRRISADAAGRPEDAARIGEQVAEELLVQGAAELIASSRVERG